MSIMSRAVDRWTGRERLAWVLTGAWLVLGLVGVLAIGSAHRWIWSVVGAVSALAYLFLGLAVHRRISRQANH